jgi:hypothetical protein
LTALAETERIAFIRLLDAIRSAHE